MQNEIDLTQYPAYDISEDVEQCKLNLQYLC